MVAVRSHAVTFAGGTTSTGPKKFAVGGNIALWASRVLGRRHCVSMPARATTSVAWMRGSPALVNRADVLPWSNGWREVPTAKRKIEPSSRFVRPVDVGHVIIAGRNPSTGLAMQRPRRIVFRCRAATACVDVSSGRPVFASRASAHTTVGDKLSAEPGGHRQNVERCGHETGVRLGNRGVWRSRTTGSESERAGERSHVGGVVVNAAGAVFLVLVESVTDAGDDVLADPSHQR